ncbi:F0F1 ATP synthase subunit B' [Fluviibacterium sp. DFM31]|uniref:ATP synthase subunit b n=1 Tax=Meridianimarinicoccus marinus TaxID=3231483 RepID=A0ABV3L3Y5_9RHOB
MADTKHVAADAAHGGGHAAEAAGMPQLEFAHFPNQIFWLIIALGAIYLILSRVALPRIAAILADRQGTITNDIAAAEELKLKAQEAETAYQKALADARAESARITAEARAAIQADLDDAIAKADAEISAKTADSEARIGEIRAGAVESVELVAKDTAAALVAALGGTSDDDAVNAAVSAQLKG